MKNLFRSLCLAGLVLTAVAAAEPAAAQGRGDHDTPATARDGWRYDRNDTPWRYGSPNCRSDDGWVYCRDRDGDWRRHHRASRDDDWWWDRDDDWFDDDDWYGRREMIDSRLVVRRLARQGFENMSDLKLRGDVYSLKAIDPYGRSVIVQVDPYSGEIVDILRR
jgi:hypothetical protein